MKSLWNRHKNKIFWIAGISGACWLGNYYLKRKWSEMTRKVVEERYWREQ
jgi:hypothetical protein